MGAALWFSLALASCGPTSWAGGIHALLAWSHSGVRVLEVPPGSPAEAAGLQPGDRVISVDSVALQGQSETAVQRLLSGEVGSRATLGVLRDGTPLTLIVEREPYRQKGATP